ncbi:MAG: phosphoserine phosphatase SerB [Candidatus Nanopelagicales bacterium]
MDDTTTLLITLSGHDRPGLTARIFEALSGDVVDVGQSVLQGRLVQMVLLRATPDEVAILSRNLAAVAAELDLDVDISLADPADRRHRLLRHRITMLGAPITPEAVAGVARAIAAAGGNIERIDRIAPYPVTAVELVASGSDVESVRTLVTEAAREVGVDISVQPVGLDRFGRRLVVLDVDSTLIQDEVIELLAAHTGNAAAVTAITDRAMRGEIDFTQSLTERVALLEGAPESVIAEVRDQIRLTPGARTLTRTLIGLGHEVALVSGGFLEVVAPVAAQLGVTRVRANRLEVVDGHLTGRVTGPVVDRAGKAAALREFAAEAGIPLSRTVAIGDGANDLDMMAAAGLGVAFNAKPVVRQAADTSVNVPFLDSVLFLLGMTREEIEAADALLPTASSAAGDDEVDQTG